MRFLSALLTVLVALPLGAERIRGQVLGGATGLPGVRVHPDRGWRMDGPPSVPTAETDAEGRFDLEVASGDQVLVVEKDGWQRDFIPRPEWNRPIPLRRAPGFREERALVVRLAFPGSPPRETQAQLRRWLFDRTPGRASVASYLYEVSKGSLLLAEGRILDLEDPLVRPPKDEDRLEIVRRILGRLGPADWGNLDRVDNRTGLPGADGKPDHLWILAPGPPRSVTLDPRHLTAICFLVRLPWASGTRWPVVFATEEVPLGTFVHESFHAMGEHRVDDLYLDCAHPLTAGRWCLMDAGQLNGWDAVHPDGGPWRPDTAYSPSQPLGWVRTELWYRGAFRETVRIETLARGSWTGWIDPLVRAPGLHPQCLRVADPRQRGAFWELSVRRPWGYDRGREGSRWGPGREGLLVAHVDPARLTESGDPRGPVRVVDARPGTPEPEPPRHPCGRWQLDDAAYGPAPDAIARGQDGPLRWEVLEADAGGRLRVRIELRPAAPLTLPR